MIRKLKKEEFNLAKRLILNTYNKTESKNDTPKGREKFYIDFVDGRKLNKMLNAEELALYGYFIDDNLAGVISLMKNGYIMHLFTSLDYMHRGVASALIDFIIAKAKEEGLALLTLDSSVYALDFYLNKGFKKEGNLIIEDGMSYIPLSYKI